MRKYHLKMNDGNCFEIWTNSITPESMIMELNETGYNYKASDLQECNTFFQGLITGMLGGCKTKKIIESN